MRKVKLVDLMYTVGMMAQRGDTFLRVGDRVTIPDPTNFSEFDAVHKVTNLLAGLTDSTLTDMANETMLMRATGQKAEALHRDLVAEMENVIANHCRIVIGRTYRIGEILDDGVNVKNVHLIHPQGDAWVPAGIQGMKGLMVNGIDNRTMFYERQQNNGGATRAN